MTLESGLEVPTEKIADICHRYGIQELAIFGSAARTDMRPDSDVDVIIEFGPDGNYGLKEFEQIESELAAIFKRRIDLGTKKYLKPHVRAHILKEARVVYAS